MMQRFACFDADGLPASFFSSDLHGSRTRPVYGEAAEPTPDDPYPLPPVIGEEPNPDCTVPADAVEITDDQWAEFLSNPGCRRWENGAVVAIDLPPPTLVTVVDAMVFWERLTAAEAETVEATMSEQGARSRNLFQKAKTFRSDHELWPLLTQLATELFGADRAAELLAPSR
ncbi:hypothetical protein [Aureimonas ureilytica]|uniref:hypothetical protein n=1 Tax=Aureimonas ureilytica TaxID=401562 RepID=UPI000734D56A|nr:hypothetical protein [Aureimonas ureilytica]